MLVRLTLVNRDEQHDHGLPTGSQLGGGSRRVSAYGALGEAVKKGYVTIWYYITSESTAGR